MSRRKCKFNEKLIKEYPMFKKTENEHEAFCKICCIIVSLANKGKADLIQHLSSSKHSKNIQSTSGSKSVNTFFVTQNTKNEEKILAVEATLAFHTVRHHHSYKSCDCSTKLYRLMFCDSEVASKISSARTKTEAIVNNVLAPHSLKEVLKIINDNNISFIGVCTDGSNHAAVKIFPILIQYFDKNFGIKHNLIELKSLPDETSETICNLLIETLENMNLLSKCIAFSGDNCNTNFGGVERRGTNNVFYRLQQYIKKPIIGIGCPAHILNNCVQHAIDGLPIDIESIILKIYNYFSIYTVRTEALKEFCIFVDVEYKKLLFHSKTRWLSLFPAINRLLQIYPALQSYFLSQNQIPIAIKSFFENPLNESYLWFIHSLMYVFHSKIEIMEKENNSIWEISSILLSVENALHERKQQEFLPLKVKEIFKNNYNQSGVSNLKKEMLNVYDHGLCYLKKWTVNFDQFNCLKWMSLNTKPLWTDIENSIVFLNKYDLQLNDSLLFDQSQNLNLFLSQMEKNEDFSSLLSDKKWVKYFEQRSYDTSSELLKICTFYFAIPAQNANVERIFSLMKAQWTDDRNRLLPDSVKNLLMTQYNFKHFDCTQFYDYCIKDKCLLSKIRSSNKY